MVRRKGSTRNNKVCVFVHAVLATRAAEWGDQGVSVSAAA